MFDLLAILVVPLAVWRIANLLADVDQTGPFNLLTWIRLKTGMSYNELSEPIYKEGSLADLLSCVYCNSIWIGIVCTIALLINIRVTIYFSLPFALSAVAIIIEEWKNAKKT